jgi:putative tryptophan/tyrosine transport system substrate-binding protein
MSRYLRRHIIFSLGGFLASPSVSAQQALPLRHVGVLVGGLASDSGAQAQLAALRQGLQQIGWREGRNMEFEHRWGEGKVAVMRTQAETLVSGKPNLIVVSTATALSEVQRVAGNIPIVFWGVSDPVGNKFVQSLARPGGNITGFSLFEYEMGGKWLQLLKEAAPGLKRALVLMSAANPNLPGWLRAIEPTALSLGLTLIRPDVTDAAQIEPAISAFAREANGGLIVLPDPFLSASRELILKLTERYRLPSIYGLRIFAELGGLISYGIDQVDLAKRAAVYVSRILNGEKPGELPVQAPTTFELVINMKTAKALGLRIPQTILVRADLVIE